MSQTLYTYPELVAAAVALGDDYIEAGAQSHDRQRIASVYVDSTFDVTKEARVYLTADSSTAQIVIEDTHALADEPRVVAVIALSLDVLETAGKAILAQRFPALAPFIGAAS